MKRFELSAYGSINDRVTGESRYGTAVEVVKYCFGGATGMAAANEQNTVYDHVDDLGIETGFMVGSKLLYNDEAGGGHV